MRLYHLLACFLTGAFDARPFRRSLNHSAHAIINQICLYRGPRRDCGG